MVNLVEYNKNNKFETLEQFPITIISRSGTGSLSSLSSVDY